MRGSQESCSNAHSEGLRRGTVGDLLDTELAQLGLQFLQLLSEVILALSPELTSLDLGRLDAKKKNTHGQHFPDSTDTAQSSMALHIPWWAASCRIVRLST